MQQPDVEARGAARQPGTPLDGHRLALVDAYGAAEEQVCAAAAHAEEARVLKEEGPFLGEVEGETGEVELLVVHLDLGEVGVVGDVEGKPLGDPVLDFASDLAVLAKAGLAGVGVVAGRGPQQVRGGRREAAEEGGLSPSRSPA